MHTTTRLQDLLDSLQQGRIEACDSLLAQSLERVRLLAQKMFRRQTDLRVLAETDDVVSQAMIRLRRVLTEVRPETVRAYYGLAAQHIRWVLRDLVREKLVHAHVVYQADPGERVDPAGEPDDLSSWSDFHVRVDELPEGPREVFDALFYQGLQQTVAAELLGISLSTLKRRWRDARIMLVDLMRGQMPGDLT